jgi:hypothetical protein
MFSAGGCRRDYLGSAVCCPARKENQVRATLEALSLSSPHLAGNSWDSIGSRSIRLYWPWNSLALPLYYSLRRLLSIARRLGRLPAIRAPF